MKRTNTFWSLWLCLALLLAAPQAQALNMYSYELDSLVYMASEIFEGELVREYGEDDLSLAEIRVSAVFMGSFKAGESVSMVTLSVYKKSVGDHSLMWKNLPADAHLVIFAVPAKSGFMGKIPKGVKIYKTVPSGLKLVENHRVLSFMQMMNPGPYVSWESPKWSDEEFKKLLTSTISDVDAIRAHLEKPTGKEDIPWLLKFIHDRVVKSPSAERRMSLFQRDAILEKSSERLVETGDLEAIAEMIGRIHYWHSTEILAQKLSTAEGRNFLLSKIENEKEPMENRIRYAKFLQAMAPYEIFFAVRMPGNGIMEAAVPADGTSGYLPRLAKIAAATFSEGPLCEELLKGLYNPIHNYSTLPPGPTPADDEVKETLRVIRELRDKADEERKHSPAAARDYQLAGIREACTKSLQLFPAKRDQK